MSDEELAAMDVMDPLVITDGDGKVIFRLLADGTAEMPDPENPGLAAAIFWREVLNMANLLGARVAFKDPVL